MRNAALGVLAWCLFGCGSDPATDKELLTTAPGGASNAGVGGKGGGGGAPPAGGGVSSSTSSSGAAGATTQAGAAGAPSQAGGAGASQAGSGADDPSTAGWVLSWSDEFNGSGLVNSADWGYEVGRVRNSEAQYYTNADADNVHMENGNLIIEAIKEPMNGASYTSASLTTTGKRQFLYGRLDVRAKIPIARGSWPAIWLLGINQRQVGWPKCGEIDVMENVGFEPTTIHATSHTQADESGSHNGTINLEGLASNYFVYRLEWTTSALDFFVDDEKIFTYTNDGAGNVDTWPYSKPFFLILNLAVGGSWGGQQGIDDTAFPLRYYIDYVRYYTKPN